MKAPRIFDRSRLLLVGVVVAAVVAVGVFIAWWRAGDAGVPSSPADVVRAYVKAYADADPAAACRLVEDVQTTTSTCTKRLQGSFAWYGHRHLRWQGVRLVSVSTTSAGGGWFRAAVRLRYRPGRGGAPATAFDTWWLRRPLDGPARIVRAAVLDSAFFGEPGAPAGSDRPLTMADVAKPARLAPAIFCGPTRRVLRPRASAVLDPDHRRVPAPWLAVGDVEMAQAQDGTTCLRLRTKARWRPSTLIRLNIQTRPLSADFAYATVRIGSSGRVVQNNLPGPQVAVGASHGQVALVIPPTLAKRRLEVTLGISSDQAEEPLIRNPLIAGQRVSPFVLTPERDGVTSAAEHDGGAT